jgi:hypothetical protein
MRAGQIQNSEFRSQKFRKKRRRHPLHVPSRPPSQSFRLCGLRDLCAMLSHGQPFSHGDSWRLPARLPSQPPSQSSPLCGLRDLCAMPSPGESFSHGDSWYLPARLRAQPPSQSSPSVASVTSVRCFPMASHSRTETVASPATASLTASVPIIPPLWPP